MVNVGSDPPVFCPRPFVGSIIRLRCWTSSGDTNTRRCWCRVTGMRVWGPQRSGSLVPGVTGALSSCALSTAVRSRSAHSPKSPNACSSIARPPDILLPPLLNLSFTYCSPLLWYLDPESGHIPYLCYGQVQRTAHTPSHWGYHPNHRWVYFSVEPGIYLWQITATPFKQSHCDPNTTWTTIMGATTSAPSLSSVSHKSQLPILDWHVLADPDDIHVQMLRKRYLCPHFRILVIGRANSGKTTILGKVCGVAKATKPIIYDKDGELVWVLWFL